MTPRTTARRSKSSLAATGGVGRPRNTEIDKAILDVAERQLRERGYAGMSVESVAADANTTVPSVRRRYRSKTDLAMAVIDSLRASPLPTPTGVPRADALAVLSNLQGNLRRAGSLTLVGSMLAEEQRHPELIGLFRRRIVGPRRTALRQTFQAAMDTRELPRDVDLDAVVGMLVGSFYARHLSHGRIPKDWSKRILGSVWPARG